MTHQGCPKAQTRTRAGPVVGTPGMLQHQPGQAGDWAIIIGTITEYGIMTCVHGTFSFNMDLSDRQDRRRRRHIPTAHPRRPKSSRWSPPHAPGGPLPPTPPTPLPLSSLHFPPSPFLFPRVNSKSDPPLCYGSQDSSINTRRHSPGSLKPSKMRAEQRTGPLWARIEERGLSESGQENGAPDQKPEPGPTRPHKHGGGPSHGLNGPRELNWEDNTRCMS